MGVGGGGGGGNKWLCTTTDTCSLYMQLYSATKNSYGMNGIPSGELAGKRETVHYILIDSFNTLHMKYYIVPYT